MIKNLKNQDYRDNQMNHGSDNILYEDITRNIIGCAMKVHSALGNGFQEVICQRALAIEMGYEGLSFEREKETGVFYRGEHIGTRRVLNPAKLHHKNLTIFVV